jgi:cardiolipin synthase
VSRRVLTLPNLVSMIRVAMVPLFLWLLFGRDDPTWAGILLAIIGCTDWVDGQLARRLGQVSELGKILDPLADRFAVAAAVVGGWIAAVLPWPVALALVIRECVVGLGALLLAWRLRAKIDVRLMGKAATLGLYTAISAFYVYAGTDHPFFIWTAWICVIPSLVLYYIVAVRYARDAQHMMQEGR